MLSWRRRLTLLSFAACSLWIIVHTELSAADKELATARLVPNFTLNDYHGSPYSLAGFSDKRFVVCAFLGTECPLAKLYAPRLTQIADQYQSQGIAFLAVNSNQQDSITQIGAYARQHDIKFPILKDLNNLLADELNVTRTPEVIVWDQNRQIRYRGRIDDQFGVGYNRKTATHYDLKNALDELVAGKPVTKPLTEPVGCLIGRVRQPDANSPVTYSKQIARVIQDRCVECHRQGEIAPFTLANYQEARGWAEMIAEVVNESRMPPWHADPNHGEFSNDRRLTASEKSQILEWVKRGAPEGDPADLPPPRQFLDGSQLPQPADLELNMRSTPFVIKAEGEIAYQNFIVDPGFTEDKWVSMAEALPGNRAVVHHIVVFILPPKDKESKGLVSGNQFLTTYVPGYIAAPLPAGMAKWIPAGSRLMFQMHYTPIGTEQQDLSKVRLVFADPKNVEHLVLSASVQIEHGKLVIPAHDDNHRSEAVGRIGGDKGRLLSLFPHMHLRGKSFRIDAKYPDGTTETLLDVPNYDFNWQTTYRLKNPKPIPKGTEMIIVGHHNNSDSNLANPDPNATVYWGDQTWEEMLIALYEWTIPIPKKT